MTLVAGCARRDITPPVGTELMGYGARRGVSTGVHDRLHARALYLGDAEAGSGCLLVTAELCLVAPDQALASRRRIAERTGLGEQQILIGCTHTHSGPDTGLAARMAGGSEPAYLPALFEGIEVAAVEAYVARAPARLRWDRRSAAIGRNRRLADGPLDPEVLVLEVRKTDGSPLAVLFNYGCHGTVLGHDNLEISADWPGVAATRIEQATGATALFLLGGHADVDPRTRGLMDPAIDGQSVGLGFDAVQVLGGEVAAAVLHALGGSGAVEDAPARSASRSLVLPIHPGALPEAAIQESLEQRRRAVAECLGVPLERFPRVRELHGLAQTRALELAPDDARELISRVRLYVRDWSGPRWTGGVREVPVEVQLLRIGEVAILALPLELTTAVGLDWKGRAPGGGVASIANGWLRYLPHPLDLAEPLAHQRYEVLSSLLAPGACEHLLAAGQDLLGEL